MNAPNLLIFRLILGFQVVSILQHPALTDNVNLLTKLKMTFNFCSFVPYLIHSKGKNSKQPLCGRLETILLP